MTGLPPALAGWADQLSFLRPELVRAIGPLVTRLDELFARHDTRTYRTGEPEGIDGLCRHGPPERLLMSEWAVAEDFPEEFERRAVSGELTYLHLSRRRPGGRDVVQLLLDCGLDQLGPARLVHVAAIVVLARRAADTGRLLSVGLLHQQPGTAWSESLSSMLRKVLGSRSAARPDPTPWLTGPDRPWLIGSPATVAAARAASGSSMLVEVRADRYSAGGVDQLMIALDGERLTLPVPAIQPSVALLRGRGFTPTVSVSPRAADTEPVELTAPILTGLRSPVLAVRAGPTTLVTVNRLAGGGAPQIRTRHFGLPVVAAEALRQRLVVVAHDEDADDLVVTVFGRSLGRLDGLRVKPGYLRVPTGTDWLRLHYLGAELLIGEGRDWCAIRPGVPVALRTHWTGLHPSGVVDAPVTVYPWQDRISISFGGGTDQLPHGARVLLGSGAVAWSDGSGWRLRNLRGSWVAPGTPPPQEPDPITVPEGLAPVGVIRLVPGEEPHLVLAGPDRVVLAGADGHQPLDLPGTGDVIVHALCATMARETGDGALSVLGFEGRWWTRRIEPGDV